MLENDLVVWFGFFIIQAENKREIRKRFLPVDVIYELVKNDKENINCYFNDQTILASQLTFIEGTQSDMI